MQITKEEILREIKERRSEFTKDEVLDALKEEKPSRFKFTKQKMISAIAYALGTLIVLIGVFLLVEEFWVDMGSLFKVGITFGLGVLVFIAVVLLEGTSHGSRILKEPLSILSAILVSSGAFVAAVEFAFLDVSPGLFLATSLMLVVMFACLYIIRRSSVYLFFVVAFASSALYSLVSLESFQRSIHQSMEKPEAVFAYLTSLLGIAYFYLAYLLKEKRLSTILYGAGALAIISPLFFLAEIYHAPIWNILAIMLITAIGFVGYYLKRTVLAVASAILLTGVLFSLNFYGFFSITTIFLLFFVIFLAMKKAGTLPYVVTTIGSITMLPYAFLSLGFMQRGILDMQNPEVVYLILTSLIGLGYILLGYFFQERVKVYERFSKFIYFLGCFGTVTPLFYLGDIQGGGWDVLAIFSIIALIVLGVYLQEKVIIVSGSALLAIHIIIVSYRYFAESIGWPVTLIIAGFLLMGVGYLSYIVSKKVD